MGKGLKAFHRGAFRFEGHTLSMLEFTGSTTVDDLSVLSFTLQESFDLWVRQENHTYVIAKK